MPCAVIPILCLLGVIFLAGSASAQYYGPGPYGPYPGPYGPGPYGPPGYGGYPPPPPGPYYGPPRRYGGGGYLRPRIDPRTGGTYCVDRRMTVQDGVCKPYRGY
jgi:hypothetical protein